MHKCENLLMGKYLSVKHSKLNYVLSGQLKYYYHYYSLNLDIVLSKASLKSMSRDD